MTADLEQQLVGHEVGAELAFDMTFPAAFRVPALAGNPARVELKISRVQESSLPELDAAFIATFGIKDGSMEQFRSDVRANLERELKGVLSARLKSDVVQKLVDSHPDLELPQRMVENEARCAGRTGRAAGQAAGPADDGVARIFPRAGASPRRRRRAGRRDRAPERDSPRQPARGRVACDDCLDLRGAAAGG
jgi:trigger factor